MSGPKRSKSLSNYFPTARGLKLDDDIHPGITWRDWLRKCAEVRGSWESFGVARIGGPTCRGGYCKRHNRKVPVRFETKNGLKLCGECATVWAVRKHYKLPRKKADL